MCPEEGCHCLFQKHGALQNHILCGRHDHQPEKITLLDRAKQGYAKRLDEQYGAVPSKPATAVCRSKHETEKTTEMGWALQSQKAKTRFNERQKDYLQRKFDKGEISGNKHKPEVVAQDMRTAKDKSGERLFTVEEFLTSKQIASFFFSLGSKKAQCSNF